jgi:hypothetical protein
VPASLPAQDQQIVREVVKDAYVETIRLVMMLAASLSWGAGLVAALTLGTHSARGGRVSPAITQSS